MQDSRIKILRDRPPFRIAPTESAFLQPSPPGRPSEPESLHNRLRKYMKKSGIFQNFIPIIFQARSETQTPIRKNTLRGSWRTVRVHRRREVGPRRPESGGESSRSGSAKIGRAPKTDRGGCIPRIHPPLCPMQNVFARPSTSPESAGLRRNEKTTVADRCYSASVSYPSRPAPHISRKTAMPTSAMAIMAM